MNDPERITVLLGRAHAGDRAALEGVARAVQSDLLRRARGLMARRPGPQGRPISLEPADLVNETFVKLLEQRNEYGNREHFFAIATKVMLRVLLDYHKARGRAKRRGVQVVFTLSGLGKKGAAAPQSEIPELMAALEKLEQLDARVCQVTKLRVLWGLSASEVADVIGVSKATADRDWRFARLWLAANLLGERRIRR